MPSIVLLSFLTYRRILGDFFTGGDTLMHIDKARIESWQDAVRLLTEPLGAGSETTEQWMFYRPLSALSYSADYALWALTPFGFHLTDLLLHTLVAVLVFFVARALCDGSRLTAWLAAVLFTTHPILVETVPASARRHDPLAGVFLLLSLLAFLRYSSRRPSRRGLLAISVIAYVLALLSKEPAIILPLLIVAFVLLVPPDPLAGNRRARILSAIKSVSPYLLASLIVLAWRTHVLGGVGGRMTGSHDSLPTIIGTPANYLLDLLYSVGVLVSLVSPAPDPVQRMLFATAALLMVVALLTFRRRLTGALATLTGPNAGRVLRVSVGLLAVVAALSLLAILVYPLATPYTNDIIRQAHTGDHFRQLGRVMSDRHVYPAEVYIFKIRDLLLTNLFAGLALSVLTLAVLAGRARLARFVAAPTGRVALFLLVWILLPLPLHLGTGVFTHRHMYLPVIPFSILIALLLVEGLRSLSRPPSARFPDRWGSVALATLAASLLFFSPLCWAYREWEDSGRVAQLVLQALTDRVPDWPPDSVLYITALPVAITAYDTAVPRVKSVTYLTHYGIKSWLDLHYPANRLRIAVLTKSRLTATPSRIEVQQIGRQGNMIALSMISHVAADGKSR